MHIKAPSTHAPFKGDAFPSYVVQRAPRSTTCNVSMPTTQQQVGLGAAAYFNGSDSSVSTPSASLTAPNASSIVSCSPVPTYRSPPPRTASSPLSSTATRSSRAAQRPSLSDQLRSISQGAQDITAQLRATHKLTAGNVSSAASTSTAVLLQATTISVTAGKLECRFPCPLLFLHDHCAFVFQHPFAAKEIDMVMYYRDMVRVRVNMRDRSFSFRVTRALAQFGSDYDPANPQHVIRVVLATASEVQRVKQFVCERHLGQS